VIIKETLTPEWIKQASKNNGNADQILVEKAIRALLLVEGLAKTALQFIFKGGTALMLLQDSAKRLSIDIDIVMHERPGNLDQLLQEVVASQHFNKIELQQRTANSGIDKTHYKFFYSPVYREGLGDDYVLLDILFEKHDYSDVHDHKLISSFVKSEGSPGVVRIPSFDDLLGDKLTAFAPNTTGVPYERSGNSMSMEIIKQLYDIGRLFGVAENTQVMKATFTRMAETQLLYRGGGIKLTDVLEDIYDTALCISLKGNHKPENFQRLQQGVKSLGPFIFSEPYRIEGAIRDAAKAAYLSRIIATDRNGIERYETPEQVAQAIIAEPHNTKLNKLKKTDPEAFFYWWKATMLFQ